MNVDAQGIHIHQSDLKGWLNCGEQQRLRRLVSDANFETDAATVGTVTHALIEEELTQGFFDNEKDAMGWAAAHFVLTLERYAAEGAVYSRSSFDTDIKALRAIERLARCWFHSPERAELAVMPDGIIVSEWDFDVPLGLQFENTDVYVAGTADLLIAGSGLWDFKTASQPYKRWEKQRWDVQPTVYTYAAAYEGFVEPDKWGEYSFTYKVFDTKGSTVGPPDSITVKRSSQNWEWLRAQVANMLVIQYALPDGPWPMDDSHVLCSEKWCPVWHHCKGQFVSAENWT